MWIDWTFRSLNTWELMSLVFFVTSIAIAIIIVLEKRSPFKTAAWILVLVLLPLIGLVFYLFFGQEFRKKKIFSRRGLKALGRYRGLINRQLKTLQQKEYQLPFQLENYRKIISLLLNNSHAFLTTGNQVRVLNNGKKILEAMFSAMESARHHIHIEFYIIENDETGLRLKNILIAKSKEGVEVRVIIDDVGSWSLGTAYIDELKSAGVGIVPFMEVRFPRLTGRVNYRNHRKIVVIDAETAFTGGVNIADRYMYGLGNSGTWRDTNVEIRGDAVATLQVVFAADWFFVTGENLIGKNYFRTFSEEPGIPVQICASGPDSDWDSIAQAFFTAITNARKEVYLVTPYLMPTPSLLTALKTAALGGIDVRIIIPEKPDALLPKWVSYSYVEELLEAGIRIYFYQKGFIHSKVIIVDGNFTTVGTTNLDFRSLETNFEVNAFIYSEQFARQMTAYFRVDMRNSREIVLYEWRKRPWHKKSMESLAYLISPLF